MLEYPLLVDDFEHGVMEIAVESMWVAENVQASM